MRVRYSNEIAEWKGLPIFQNKRVFAGCQNSTALNSLHYSIRSRVEVNFVHV